jgi:four helix bundle protein
VKIVKGGYLPANNLAMATLNNFEELEIWKSARLFAQKVFELSSNGSFAEDFALRDQINRSSGSTMDNIAEGFERNGKNEFVNFLSIAKGSIAESRSQLYRALDRKYLEKDQFEQLQEESEKITHGIGALIQYLKKSNLRGIKFKDRKP